MTPDRGPDGRSLGHSHVEHVQPPNRGYAGYYLPNLYQENYRIRSAEELDALPDRTIVVGATTGEAWAYTRIGDRWFTGSNGFVSEQVLAQLDPDEWLFVVYRPDMVPPRRDPA